MTQRRKGGAKYLGCHVSFGAEGGQKVTVMNAPVAQLAMGD